MPHFCIIYSTKSKTEHHIRSLHTTTDVSVEIVAWITGCALSVITVRLVGAGRAVTGATCNNSSSIVVVIVVVVVVVVVMVVVVVVVVVVVLVVVVVVVVV